MNIRELARLSGVSTATVSRALNGRGEVSEVTRRRISELAREMGYAPNEPARTLVRRRSDTIGLVWDSGYERRGLHHPFLQGLLSGVRAALQDAGYHLMLLTTAGDKDDDDTYLQAVRRHNLEAVVVMGVQSDDRAVRALADSPVVCVGIDLALSGPHTARVTSDNEAGAAAAVRHLFELGHRRLATITGPVHMPPAADRLKGFLTACAELGVPVPDSHVREGDFFLAGGQQAMAELLALPEPPTAVFAAGDQMAIGALHAAAQAGRAVPADVAVVGFDDIDAASLVRPALTTVAQDERALGAAAVAALRRMLERRHEGDGTADGSGAADPGTHVVSTRLVVRESSAPR
ncbi:LacI family DNA-binding transcriptional regulator [Wenjunlia tyrosinilytica]|uniref:LacI family transcriptional regulator n=1 Tax=Wenjunlia tyrosinilytica TaxID=1544741 RepID=A0A917ZLK2_9ACTN|nr:LacI family DNA-binding transcriptional regulator [Wenjunlia tyrosinilytica]GGO84495.1 LacI family transcriptional regulator [Wenjunlia tyrosinilytica]